MKVPKITSVTEILDLNREKKRSSEELAEKRSSKMTCYVVASASALLPEKYAFHLTKKILKNTKRKEKTPEL